MRSGPSGGNVRQRVVDQVDLRAQAVAARATHNGRTQVLEGCTTVASAASLIASSDAVALAAAAAHVERSNARRTGRAAGHRRRNARRSRRTRDRDLTRASGLDQRVDAPVQQEAVRGDRRPGGDARRRARRSRADRVQQWLAAVQPHRSRGRPRPRRRAARGPWVASARSEHEVAAVATDRCSAGCSARSLRCRSSAAAPGSPPAARARRGAWSGSSATSAAIAARQSWA
mgnify:CR=1 FL=1